jgi:hypothetical protein
MYKYLQKNDLDSLASRLTPVNLIIEGRTTSAPVIVAIIVIPAKMPVSINGLKFDTIMTEYPNIKAREVYVIALPEMERAFFIHNYVDLI